MSDPIRGERRTWGRRAADFLVLFVVGCVVLWLTILLKPGIEVTSATDPFLAVLV